MKEGELAELSLDSLVARLKAIKKEMSRADENSLDIVQTFRDKSFSSKNIDRYEEKIQEAQENNQSILYELIRRSKRIVVLVREIQYYEKVDAITAKTMFQDPGARILIRGAGHRYVQNLKTNEEKQEELVDDEYHLIITKNICPKLLKSDLDGLKRLYDMLAQKISE